MFINPRPRARELTAQLGHFALAAFRSLTEIACAVTRPVRLKQQERSERGETKKHDEPEDPPGGHRRRRGGQNDEPMR